MSNFSLQTILQAGQDEFLDQQFAEKVSALSIDPDYRIEVGQAQELYGALEQKLQTVNRGLFKPKVWETYQSALAVLDFRRVTRMEPEELSAFIRHNAARLIMIDTVDLEDRLLISAFELRYHPRRFQRWIEALQAGLSQCTANFGSTSFVRTSGERVNPTIADWIADFERYSASHGTDQTLAIAEYLSKSGNIKQASEAERAIVTKLLHWWVMLQYGPGAEVIEQPELIAGRDQAEDRVRAVSAASSDDQRIFVRPQDRTAPNGFIRTMAAVQPPRAQSQMREDAPIPPPITPPRSVPVVSSIPPVAPIPIKTPLPVPPLRTPPVISPPVQRPASVPVEPKTPEDQVRVSLQQGQELVERFEAAERQLPPAQPESIRALAEVCAQAVRQGDATPAVAGIFQIARQSGVETLLHETQFSALFRTEAVNALQQTLRWKPEFANHVAVLPSNRIVLLKEFLRALLTRSSGSETLAARIMVHIANIIPEKFAGPESTFAYFDLPSRQYRWAATIVQPDGSLTSRIH